MRVNPAAEPLYIVNPLQANARGRGGGGVRQLFSTHPPMEERVARLRRMAGASSLQLAALLGGRMGIQDEVRRLVNTESARHKRLIEYVTRQLRAGRKLADVLDDPYVVNRSNLVHRRALLEEPEVDRRRRGRGRHGHPARPARGGHRGHLVARRRYNRPRKGSISR